MFRGYYHQYRLMKCIKMLRMRTVQYIPNTPTPQFPTRDVDASRRRRLGHHRTARTSTFRLAPVPSHALSRSRSINDAEMQSYRRKLLTLGEELMFNVTDRADDPSASRPQRAPYAWPLLWVVPGAIFLTFVMFRDGVLRRCCRGVRRRRHGRMRMRDATGTTHPREFLDTSSSSTSSVADAAEAREMLSVLRRAEEGSAMGDDNATFDAWRQLSIGRESDFMRRRLRDVDEESEHRRAIVTLPEGVLAREAHHHESFWEQQHKRIRPATRRVIQLLPRCVVGSPRWWQFLRATNMIETRGVNDKGEKETIAIELECPICVETLEAEEIAIITRCQHVFHQQCLVAWLRLHASCPTCRSEITRMTLVDRMAAFTKYKSSATSAGARSSASADVSSASASATWAA